MSGICSAHRHFEPGCKECQAPVTARHDKATEGRTEAAAVDQAIADVREAMEAAMGTDFRLNGCACLPDAPCYLHSNVLPGALAALRVLADAVEELRGDYEKQREYADEQYRKALAAEAERDEWERVAGESQNRMSEHAFRAERLARQVADLEAALRDGERIALQYLNTERGDLDGWVERARAALTTDKEPA